MTKDISILIVELKENMCAEETLEERVAVYVSAAQSTHVLTTSLCEFPIGVFSHIFLKNPNTVQGRFSMKRFIMSAIPDSVRGKGNWVIVADGEENVVYAARLSRAFNIPLDVAYDTTHHLAPLSLLTKAMNHATSVRVSSRRVADMFVARFPDGPSPVVLPMPFSNEEISTVSTLTLSHIADSSHVVGFVSDSASLGILLLAWRHVTNRYPSLRLSILVESPHGPFRETYALAAIAVAGFGDAVKVISCDDINRVRTLLTSARFFLHVSNHLPYGRRLVGVRAFGIPTITVDTGVVGERINKNTVLVCPVGDSACIAKHTLFMLDNPSVYESLYGKNIVFDKPNTCVEMLCLVWDAACAKYKDAGIRKK